MTIQVKWIREFDDALTWLERFALIPEQRDSIFFTPLWLRAAWQWQQTTAQCQTLMIFEDNKPLAMMPLARKVKKQGGILFSTLEFISIPDTQQCDILFFQNPEPRLYDALWHALRNAHQWDCLHLHYLSENNYVRHLHPQALTQTIKHPVIQIETSWDEYYKTRSRRLKKGNNLVLNHLKKNGSFEICEWDSPKELPLIIDVAEQISAKSWKQDTGNTFDFNGPNAFLQSLCTYALPMGCMRFWALKIKNEIAAMELHLEHENNIYALRSDYIDKYSDLSPGTYLNWQLIQRYFNEGKKCIYLGPGENKYKLRWLTHAPPVFTFTYYQHNFKGQLLKAYRHHLASTLAPIKNNLSRWLKRKHYDPRNRSHQ